MKPKTAEVITPEVLDSQVDLIGKTAVAQYSITDAALAELESKWKDRTIQGPSDKVGYELVRTGIAELRSLRNRVEDKRKELKEPFLRAGQSIDAEAKRIATRLQPLENALKAEKERVDNEIEAIKRAEYERRVKSLREAGFLFDGRVYQIGLLIVHSGQIESMEPEAFTNLIESGKVEADRIRKEEEARREHERHQRELAEELARKERELAAREASLKAKETAEMKPAPVQAPILPSVKRPQPMVTFDDLNDEEDMPSVQTPADLSSDYLQGFNDCREAIKGLLGNQYGSKSAFIDAINSLVPGVTV